MKKNYDKLVMINELSLNIRKESFSNKNDFKLKENNNKKLFED